MKHASFISYLTARRGASARTFIGFSIVLVLAALTYVRDYGNPSAFFWDENYHIASAQKYLNGIFFMEPHPPLGKLFIALGEYLVHANPFNNQFIGTDHAGNAPQGFSFLGYRLFPVLFAWLTAPLLFLVLELLTGNWLWALLLSFLYVFDNALIVHSRGAMLEGTQLFFVVLSTYSFLRLYRRPRACLCWAVLLGISLGAAIMTKYNALIFTAYLGALGIRFFPNWRKITALFAISGAALLLVFLSVWLVHFALASTPERKLSNRGYYEASPEYRKILSANNLWTPYSIYIMLRDSLAFVPHYQRGVPKLNLCNQGENGSPPDWWPLGGRAIDYRWESRDGKVRYLYLQINPAVWALSLLGVISGLAITVTQALGAGRTSLKRFPLIALFSVMYGGYMFTMFRLTRVMYLYHYFLPLLLGIFLLALAVRISGSTGRGLLSSDTKSVILVALIGLVLGCYGYFAPLTYALPLSNAELESRAWLSIWDLRCPNCKVTNGLAETTCDPKLKTDPQIYLAGIKAERASQDWGDPKQDETVDGSPLIAGNRTFGSGIGVHANSSIQFPIFGKFSKLSGAVALPDYLLQKNSRGSVAFEVRGDGVLLWQSPVMSAGDPPKDFAVELKGVQRLELAVQDGGDGIDNDHAVWLELALKP